MIYIVSADDQTETLRNAGEYGWEAYFSDAKLKAQTLANVNEKPFYIYSFEQCDCIEPKETQEEKTFELTFGKVDKTNMTVKAGTLEEAIEKARNKIGYEWELYTGYGLTDE